MEWFGTVGPLVDRWWTEVGRDEEAFPDVAERAIREVPPLAHVDVDAFVRRTLAVPAERQFAPPGAFGQPGVTAWHGGDFLIDVYFWTSGLSAIHDHPFCGLFTILRGFSVHSLYRFEALAEAGPRAVVGRLTLDDVEVLHPGDHRTFSPRTRPLIHSLIHVPNPSVSLVIRTARTENYYRYLPPAVAVRIGPSSPETERRQMLLEFLRGSGDPGWHDRVGEFVATHDFDAALGALARAWPGRSDDRFRALVERGRPRHGAAMDVVEATVATAHRRAADERIRERFADSDGRFVATVLAQAQTRPRVLRLLRERYGESATDHLLEWFARSGLFGPDAPGLEVARLLARDPLPPDTQTPEGLDPRIVRYFRGSILEPLLA